MKLTSQPVSDLLAAFRSSEPTPGGGSAAALAGGIGASLLVMVAALPKPQAAAEEDVQRLAKAGSDCSDLAIELERLVDEDSAAYDLVVGAFRLPRGTDVEKVTRTAAIQRALTAATEAPLRVMRSCARALTVAPVVAALGNPNASSDVEVAIGLLEAGLHGARKNVAINLGSIKDEAYVQRVREEVESLISRRP
jgi:formiminotetrahydrofolate cyclodeaminase